MDKLLIIGAGGHGKVVADIAIRLGKYREIAFLDDDESKKECLGLPVLGRTEYAIAHRDEYEAIVAIGESNATRERVQISLEEACVEIATLIHPSAVVGAAVSIGAGSVLVAGAVINADSTVGRGVILNTLSSVGHDCVVGDFCHISSGVRIGGVTRIGKRCWIGIGACVSNVLSLCDDCFIGAGATVIRDISVKGTYVGTPAKFLKP